jgi:hypothetical protein
MLFLTQNVSFAHLDVVSRRTPAYYDEEYYDYDYSEPETEVKSEEYDLSELVKAWKEYIKEKTTQEQLKEYECEPKEDSYRTSDPEQCDK